MKFHATPSKAFKIILPYYPTGTMERVDQDGQIATAATLAKMVSNVPMTLSGPAQIILFDIHALQERFYFSDQVIPRLESGVPWCGINCIC
jgi:phosphoribosylpyrophosphate synthetase